MVFTKLLMGIVGLAILVVGLAGLAVYSGFALPLISALPQSPSAYFIATIVLGLVIIVLSRMSPFGL